MIKTFFLTFSMLILSAIVVGQSPEHPTGTWQTIDDQTGQVKSLVEIYEKEGRYFGRVAAILTDKKEAVCTECSGALKNQPILGMTIIKDLQKDGDEWNGGTILDPNKGAEYRLVAWFEEDPNKLFIRGKHWTGLYRTQTWHRQ